MYNRSAITKVQAVTIVVIIVVAALIGVYYYYTNLPVGGAPEKIKVGMIVSLSGAFASAGRLSRICAEEAVKMINDEGGVYLKDYRKKVPMELTVYDDESNPSRGTELAGTLVNEGVVAVICSSYAHIVIPIAKVTERYGVPLLNPGTPKEMLEAAGPWNYTWNYGMSYKKINYGFIQILNNYKKSINSRIAVILSDDAIGRTHRALIPRMLEDAGYYVFCPDLYPPQTTDFTSLITQIKEQNCDVLWMHGSASTFATFWRQCLSLGYKPKILYQSGGLARLEEVNALGGELAKGIITHMVWHPNYPYLLSTTFKQIYSKYLLEQNIDLSPVGAYYFTIWFILKDALERTGNLNKEALNKAIGETNIIGAPGPVSFNLTTHSGTGLITLGQWIKGEYGQWILAPIWSEVPEVQTVTVTPIFPLP